MKITKYRLKQIIKEELTRFISEQSLADAAANAQQLGEKIAKIVVSQAKENSPWDPNLISMGNAAAAWIQAGSDPEEIIQKLANTALDLMKTSGPAPGGGLRTERISKLADMLTKKAQKKLADKKAAQPAADAGQAGGQGQAGVKQGDVGEYSVKSVTGSKDKKYVIATIVKNGKEFTGKAPFRGDMGAARQDAINNAAKSSM